MKMRIRLCKKEDVPYILRLGKDIFKGEKWYRKNVLGRVIRENPKTCWVLEIDGRIEGARFVYDDFDGRAWGWLLLIGKNFRRKGLGSILFDITAEKLRKMGFRKIYGECGIKNKTSIKWHLKTGYKRIGTFPDWYGKGLHAVVFDYDL